MTSDIDIDWELSYIEFVQFSMTANVYQEILNAKGVF